VKENVIAAGEETMGPTKMQKKNSMKNAEKNS
jgi:hypothetical protein